MENDINITTAQYEALVEGVDVPINYGIKATIDGQEMSVPLDTANRHYAEILKQVEAGDLTIADAE